MPLGCGPIIPLTLRIEVQYYHTWSHYFKPVPVSLHANEVSAILYATYEAVVQIGRAHV